MGGKPQNKTNCLTTRLSNFKPSMSSSEEEDPNSRMRRDEKGEYKDYIDSQIHGNPVRREVLIGKFSTSRPVGYEESSWVTDHCFQIEIFYKIYIPEN